ncbi:MAG: aminodeoxychorismate lyase [SAR86 cluster bacterium]|uniref:Aminodeoxychorismate lyase n=1 Tax=SAR86 cluster bacterium TaxID=2030880 RepID=A0A2A4X1X5_9GAMM|nr:MAG: aminodeoxychorismate lyase [SAR86 cluster bacterium]
MLDGPLQSLINGQQAEHISIRDRGFQYGDGCFETVRVLSSKPILWPAHLKRLQHACKTLQLSVNFELLQSEISQLLQANKAADVILKITITRGEGGRGYAPTEQTDCTRIMQLINYVAPVTTNGARVVICQHKLSSNSLLAGIKHLNRLDQVLASAQIPTDFDEGLCMDEEGYVIEGCRSNLLLSIGNKLVTPDLSKSGVQGVMLNHLIDEFAKQGTRVVRKTISLGELKNADEIFLCNSVFGVWPIAEIQNEDWGKTRKEEPFSAAALEIHNKLFRNNTQ